MAVISTITAESVVGPLSVLAPFAELLNHSRDFDLVIVVCGFEDRNIGMLRQFQSERATTRKILCLTYSRNFAENMEASIALVHSAEVIAGEVLSAEGDGDGVEFEARLTAILEELREEQIPDFAPRVLFDISAASSKIILRCLHLLLNDHCDLTITYSRAITYFPTQAEYRDLLPSLDEADAVVRGGASLGLDYDAAPPESSREYPGQHLDALPDRLVVFAGFNGQRARAIIEYVDDSLLLTHPNSSIEWVVGEPLLEDDAWRAEAQIHVNGLRMPNDEVAPTVHYVSTFSVSQTVSTLEQIYVPGIGREHLTIAPLGSKLQTVGVAVFCEIHAEVAVVMSAPEGYNGAHYSAGVRDVWGMRVGLTRALRAQLRRVGSIEFVD